MTALALPRAPLRVGLLLVGFAGAVTARLAVGGPGPARSPSAGLAFAAMLVAFAWAARTALPVTGRAVLQGLAGATLLSLPLALLHLGSHTPSSAGFAGWLPVVAVVATAEEVFLRGTLYDAIPDTTTAIFVGAIAFALLHVPLYGWHVVPLDLVVGLVLGELRRSSGTAAAPAVAHVIADAATWFLR